MKKIEELRRYFTKGERALWFGSVFVIIAAFYFFDRSNYFTLFASLLGVTSLIFNAKGNPFGQLLMILFSLLYGIISFTFSYYGEMLRFLYKGIIIKHNKTEPTYTKTSLFLCEKRRFFMARTEKGVVTTI